GEATTGRRWMLTDAVTVSDPRHQLQYYLDLVKEVLRTTENSSDAPPNSSNSGVRRLNSPLSPELEATSDERNMARKMLAAEGIPCNAPFLVLSPGAAYGTAKRWHEDRFADVADDSAHKLGFNVAEIGS